MPHNYSASVPPQVYRDKELLLSELRVYCEIEAAGNGKKDMWAKSKEIADILCMDKRTVQNAIRKLESKGYLVRWYDGNIRHIGVVSTDTRVVSTDTTKVVSTDTRGVVSTDTPIEGSKEKSLKEVIKKRVFGEYKNVKITEKQHEKLISEWGENETSRMIAVLDEGIQLKGYKYKDHNLALRKWKGREEKNKPATSSKASVSPARVRNIRSDS